MLASHTSVLDEIHVVNLEAVQILGQLNEVKVEPKNYSFS